MPRVTPVNWKKLDKFLLFVGCELVRQESSHRVYWRNGLNRPVILPAYNPVPIFIIKNILRQLAMDNETYLQILSKL